MNQYKEPCHCCGKETYKTVYSPNIYQCTNCNHIFKDYSHVDLDTFYNEQYRKTHRLYPIDIRRGFAQNIVELISPHIADCDTILEIGAGDGVLSQILKHNGNTVIASEINEELRFNLEMDGYKTFGDYRTISAAETFDCSISTDVLEHIEHPEKYVEKMNNICSKKVVVQVPILRDIEYQADETWDGHFHHFTEKSIRILFEKYFDVEFIFNEESYKRFAWHSEMIVVFKKKD